MDFEPQLRKFLENLPGAPAPVVRLRHIDPAELYRHLLEQLRKQESVSGRGWVGRIHRRWSPERLGQFARYLEIVPSPLGPTDEQGAREFAARALDHAMGSPDPAAVAVERLEFERIAGNFGGGGDIYQYALEVQLTHPEPPDEVRITNLGRAFLRLRGRDAIRWLLTAEVSQSTGRWDAWRTSRLLLKEALIGIDAVFDGDELQLPYAPETLDRLVALGVLVGWAPGRDEAVDRYAVQDGMQDLVQAVLEAGPWQAAVAALLEDERAVVVRGHGPLAADAANDLTKLITHEVRNALVPVRHHIDAMRATHPGGDMSQRIDKARRGVVRVLEFVDELVATRDLLGEPPTSCDAGDVIREAINWADGGERVQIVLGGQHRVRAVRSRLVRAVSNIVLNALQATLPDRPVRVSHRTNNDAVEIVVEDGGGGVPAQLRAKVFDDGYTTRGGPGHGFGLAFVRGVVEGQLQGKVWCEDSDLGGAKFVIAIPTEAKP